MLKLKRTRGIDGFTGITELPMKFKNNLKILEDHTILQMSVRKNAEVLLAPIFLCLPKGRCSNDQE